MTVAIARHGNQKRRTFIVRRQKAEPVTETAARGRRAQDHRSSLANVWRRRDRGETPIVCPDCGCEIDVEQPAHAPRCPARSEAA